MIHCRYGPAVSSITYLYAFMFESHTSAQSLALLLNFITGIVLIITSVVLKGFPETTGINDSLQGLFMMFPAYEIPHSVCAVFGITYDMWI